MPLKTPRCNITTQRCQILIIVKEKDKTFKFAKHVSTETSVNISYLMYKAFEVEFIISRQKC